MKLSETFNGIFMEHIMVLRLSVLITIVWMVAVTYRVML